MIQKILILGSVLAMAGVAQAEPVNVSLQGKSEAAIRIELMSAAKQVCKQASDAFTSADEYADCVSNTYSTAVFKLKRALVAQGPSGPSKLAAR